ncbi:MAG: aminodeoxychorismate/anthranilate synthase component II [Planctomycetes bacterium]|nr:aminodeoxychorismate/anthranilate synthase component II [Planctomycetota bacterium]
MILIIDNYDSFTYNLVQVFGEMGRPLQVFRNDKLPLAEAIALRPTHLVISPGPGGPADAGVSNDLIQHFADKIPVLGVCLGHQCLAYCFGGEVNRADRMMHGKVSLVYHDGKGIYRGLPNPFAATRYHSLIVREESLPAKLVVTSHTSEGEIMGIRLKGSPVEGVQFHPESVLTTVGKTVLQNFLDLR